MTESAVIVVGKRLIVASNSFLNITSLLQNPLYHGDIKYLSSTQLTIQLCSELAPVCLS